VLDRRAQHRRSVLDRLKRADSSADQQHAPLRQRPEPQVLQQQQRSTRRPQLQSTVEVAQRISSPPGRRAGARGSPSLPQGHRSGGRAAAAGPAVPDPARQAREARFQSGARNVGPSLASAGHVAPLVHKRPGAQEDPGELASAIRSKKNKRQRDASTVLALLDHELAVHLLCMRHWRGV
jgi:hypothetical protein